MEGLPYDVRGRGLKSESLSCGLTTHLHVVGNFGSRGRALCGFSTLYLSLLLPPSHPARVSLEGAARVFRGPEERGSLSREEIVFPSRGRKFSCHPESNFLRERDVAEKEKERDIPSSDASPDALYGMCRGLISG